MITPSQLQSAFTWEFSEPPENITYRKHTTDTIPEYTLTLRNSSDEFYINVFAAQLPYTTMTVLSNNAPLTLDSSVLLPPGGQEDVLVTFSYDEINASVDITSRISFVLEALVEEQSTPLPPDDTPEDDPIEGDPDPLDEPTPTVPTSSGGQRPPAGDPDDFTGPDGQDLPMLPINPEPLRPI